MYKFSAPEVELLIDAINMAIASNKRMQTSKPKFHVIWDQIDTDLRTLIYRLQNPEKQK